MKNNDLRTLTRLALLVAIELVMKAIGLGSVPMGPLYMSFLTLPIAVGAITMGPVAGAVLGGVFGAVSFYDAVTGASAMTGALFQVSPVNTFILCVGMRVLMGVCVGLTMGVPDPHAVGKDRLVDAAYAAANFPLPVITVDLGTATTFNVVDENRVFRGGVICPGLSTGLRALGERCAQLPQVRLSSPKTAIGVNTESCMLSGSVLGTAVLLDGITQRIEEELGRPATLVVTGGLAKYVTPLCRHPLTYDPELLLKGLALLYQMNAPQPHYAAGGRRRNPNNNFRRGRRPRSQRRERREEENKNG